MRTVREIMEPDVFWLPADMPLKRAAEELAYRQIGGAPACGSDGTILGMVSQADLAEYYGGVNELRLVRDVMTPEIIAVAPEDPIERAIESMAFEGVHRLLVLDNEERLMGIVTTMDVLRELAGYRRPRPRVHAVAPPDRSPDSERPSTPSPARPSLQPKAQPSQSEIDEMLAESFPASDPPPWTLGWARRSLSHPRR